MAAFTFLNVPNATDYAFDSSDDLYISAGPNIVRYSTVSQSFLPSFNVGGALIGISLSPDGTTLAAADGTIQGSNDRVDLINVSTGSTRAVSFSLSSGEDGTFMTAWGNDGTLLVDSSFNGTGSVPLRLYNPSSGSVTNLALIPNRTVLSASSDNKTIAIAKPYEGQDSISAFDVASKSIVATAPLTFIPSDVAINRNDNQFVAPTYQGAIILNRNGSTFTQQAVIGQYASHGPVSAVYSPVADYLFTAESDYSGIDQGVKVYDATTMKQVAMLDNYNFPWDGNDSLTEGWMKVSPDGRWLVVSVANGARLYDVSAYAVPETSSMVLMLLGTAVWNCSRRCCRRRR